MIKGDIVLSSGKVLTPNDGIIGIDEKGAVFQGYDRGVFDPDYDDYLNDEPSLTPSERTELADLMLARWSDFKARAEKERGAA